MIAESLIDLFFNLILGVLSGVEMVGVPYSVVNGLSNITACGIWVCGADVISVFVATVVGWWLIKFAVGLVVWVWELLPLT